MDTSPTGTKKGVNMTTLELQKMAVEVRKGILTAVHAAKSGDRKSVV